MDDRLLFFLLKKAGLYSGLDTSTIRISIETGQSQQTISRKLRILEKNGMIEREVSQRGMKINFTDKAVKFFREKYDLLEKVFFEQKSLDGILISGLGEGRYYISKKEYTAEIISKMHFKPYPGTLNLKIDEKKARAFISAKNEIKIRGFVTNERSYGNLKCYPVKIGKLDCAIVIPERTTHESDVIEVISDHYLRDKLRIKDNSRVILK